jgi:tetratricopeptide (TPR) repeat protein
MRTEQHLPSGLLARDRPTEKPGRLEKLVPFLDTLFLLPFRIRIDTIKPLLPMCMERSALACCLPGVMAAFFLAWAGDLPAQNLLSDTNGVVVIDRCGKVEVLRAVGGTRNDARPGDVLRAGDRLVTGEASGATLRWQGGNRMQVSEMTEIEVPPAPAPAGRTLLKLVQGLLYLFHRGERAGYHIETSLGWAAILGTEFTLEAAKDGATTLCLIDGEAGLSNAFGGVRLTSRERGLMAPGHPPTHGPRIEIINDVIQCFLYYPAVLDVEELPLRPEEQGALAESLVSYRRGDLRQALAKCPGAAAAESPAGKVYRAALLLSVGQIDRAEALLPTPGPEGRQDQRSLDLALALGRLITAVKYQTNQAASVAPLSTNLATAWMAESYYRQSRGQLEPARQAAARAAELCPRFGFAWARLAEMEFSFGNTGPALRALEKGLQLSPSNAAAAALQGFLYCAQNKFSKARDCFERAIAEDGALGNAWLGRGLCRLRQGDLQGGRQDLQTAAALEPQRSVLRSYLAKAYSREHERLLAREELQRARQIDEHDPTPWLYGALLLQEQNRVNEAVRELERSQALNDNRALYRSEFLLDQDLAVRSVSLASIYGEAGMSDVGLREAARAVTYDYANYSAHLFLANSLATWRDPTRFNLRYETPWFNELLLANLLAPGGVGSISPNISQQEYYRLFESDKLGLVTTTEARSDGQYRELASQFGSYGPFSYSLDLDWQRNEGVRPNNALSRTEWYSQFKVQLTPQDSVLLLTKYQDYHSGDNFQYYDPKAVISSADQATGKTTSRPVYSPYFTFDEVQEPIVLGAYHREWIPGVHTLALGGRLVNDQHVWDQALPLPVLSSDPTVSLANVNTEVDVAYRSQLEIWTGELNQIFQGERNTLILGGRFQTGDFETANSLTNTSAYLSQWFPPTQETLEEDFQRRSLYAYDTYEVLKKQLWLTAGLAYDQMRYPDNYRQVPISPGASDTDLVGPKAALVWSPCSIVTLRGAYSRSLGGVSMDESIRLEPPQLAGFSQSYRTLISESVVGSVSAPTFETWGAALDLKLKTHTYLGLMGELLSSEVDRTLGVYGYDNSSALGRPSSTPQHLDYQEYSAGVALHQLLDDEWALSVSYKFVRSELERTLPEVTPYLWTSEYRADQADLHTFSAALLYRHRCGFFARAEANYYLQDNRGWSYDSRGQAVEEDQPEDHFPQINFWVGYRWRRNLGDIAVGLLNATGTDYKLNPLNPYAELPRERVVAARLRLRF